MIEINLLPGSRSTKRSGGSAMSVGALFSGVSDRIKDPFLAVAVVGLVIGLAAVGYMYNATRGATASLDERERVARADSTRFATVIADRRAAEASRDSVLRQFSIVRAIDRERYIWPHILDELSEHLPPYTWLTRVEQQSPAPTIAERDSAAGAAATAAQGRGGRGRGGAAQPAGLAASLPPMRPVTLRVDGQTVDIQALTRYMRMLESSPFLTNVNILGSTLVTVENREATEFRLEMRFAHPDPSVIRTEPITVGGQ